MTTTDTPPPSGVGGLVARVQAIVAWFQGTRAGRTLARYGAARGGLLAGGIAYAGLFSIFSALTIGFTAFVQFLGDDEELYDAVLDALDQALPGIVDTGDGGLLNPDDLVASPSMNVAGIIATVTLLLSAIAVMGALGTSIRAMFGLVVPPGNAIVGRLRDLVGFVVLALSVVMTAALGIAAGVAGGWVADAIGLTSGVTAFLVRLLGYLVAFVVDAAIFALLIRVLAGARPPRRDLLIGASIGAVASGVIRYLGTTLVGGATANPLLASFAAIVTLLLWVNLVARVMLYVSAWTANPPPVPPTPPQERLHLTESPNYVTVSTPATLEWDYDERTGAVQLSEAEEPEAERDHYWGGWIGALRERRLARVRRRRERLERAESRLR